MQPVKQTAYVLADNEAPKDSFDEILELTKEEKQELIKLWKNKLLSHSAFI